MANLTPVRRKAAQAHRGLRIARMMAKALVSTRHPILVHLVATRRCNLSCAYCNEYDQVSQPVPLDTLVQRVDHLASLGTSIITLTGGEPLLHPDLDGVVARIRQHGIIATVITNGYLLTKQRIERLNSSGLDYLQISIDNVKPDEVSMKSLKVLDQKLVLLSEYAEFGVNANAVIGTGAPEPEGALTVASRARELGFNASLGILHDGKGRMKPLSERERLVYNEIKKTGGRGFTLVDSFQENLARGKPNHWKCRAGSRYFYVDEFGLVHWCSQQKGYPAVSLDSYTHSDMRREYLAEKACAPYCTLQCVHRSSMMDGWRHPQTPLKASPARAKAKEGPGA